MSQSIRRSYIFTTKRKNNMNIFLQYHLLKKIPKENRNLELNDIHQRYYLNIISLLLGNRQTIQHFEFTQLKQSMIYHNLFRLYLQTTYIIFTLLSIFLTNFDSYILKIEMKNQIINKAFENLFQLNTQPIYVSCQTQQENLIETVNDPSKKLNVCPTMFNAICNVQQDGVIKVNTGLYNQNLQIKLPGIRIQNNDSKSNVVMASQQYPTFIINLPNKDDKLFMESLKFAHLCQFDKDNLRWPSSRELRDNRYRGLKTSQNMNTSILLKRGTLQLDQCRLSFAGQKDSSKLFPIIVVQQQGSLIITRSQLLGGSGSIGIFCNGGKLNIRECSFKNHGGMAILITGGKQTSLILKNSNIASCSQGIVLNGPFSSSIENNNIVDCSHSGIVTLFGNISNLINNQISKCKNGIEIQNSLPKIMKNNLLKNKQFGISIYSKMNRQCRPHIRFNLVSENKRGGIFISGSRNTAEIYNNIISYNQKIGVKIESNAHPHIFLNQILNNFGNGIYLSSGGTAFLQKNNISGSINCNLILQGPNNIDNYVYNNKITNARGQGILLVYCQKFLIAKNQICHNYNGILGITSVVNIQDNRICENKCNGIILIDDCKIRMSENIIESNKKSGFLCRNSSRAIMHENKFGSNKIQILIQKKWDGMEDIENENQFEEGSDIRIPGNLCALI